jgi:CDP-diacylglycerol--serine O-phosphatidyltransferase
VFRIKKPKLIGPLPFIKLIPNMLTILALCVGFSSIRFALDSRWEMAVSCIALAAILDGLDGRVARMLNATSHFGAELDSLCDFVNFGVAPALLIYLWSFQQFEFKMLSWAGVSLFVVCMGLRLARFNTHLLLSPEDKLSKNFFTGVPAPLGALFLLIPVMLDFDITTTTHLNIRSHTILLTFYQIAVAFLLTSRLPIFSLKNIVIKPQHLWICLFCSGLFIVALMLYPWYVMPILGILYMCTIPASILAARKIN